MSKDTIEIPDFDFDGIEAPEEIEAVVTPEAEVETPEATPEVETPAAEVETPDVPEELPGEEKKPVAEKEAETTDAPEGDEEDDSTVVSEIIESLGYEVDGEFEETPKGIAELTKVIGSKIANEKLDDIFAQHPTIKAHFDYVQKGGDPDNFMKTYGQEIDYAKIEIREDDIASQKAILSDYFAARGEDPTFVKDILEGYADKGNLAERAEAARGMMEKVQLKNRAALMAEQEAKNQSQREAANEVWGKVKTIIKDNDTLAGIPVSTKNRAKFEDYISKPIDAQGRTQRDVDHGKATLEQQLALDYLMFMKMDMGKFIETKAKTTSAKNLKDRLINVGRKPKEGAGRTTPKSTNALVETIDLDFEAMGS